MNATAALRETFGGHWDGSEREIHGLIERNGRQLKIELLRASMWHCSVFHNGVCASTAADAIAPTAVRVALEALER